MAGTRVRVRRGTLQVDPDAVRLDWSPLASVRGTVAWVRNANPTREEKFFTLVPWLVFAPTIQLPFALFDGLADGHAIGTLQYWLEWLGYDNPFVAAPMVLVLCFLAYRAATAMTIEIRDLDRVAVDPDRSQIDLVNERGPHLSCFGRTIDLPGGEVSRTFHPVDPDERERLLEALQMRGLAVSKEDLSV